MGAPLSEYYGRRPVFLYGTMFYTVFSGACIAAPNLDALIVLRFFAGTFGSVPTTNSGAVCGDIWNARDRGIAMAFYSLATFAGPAFVATFFSQLIDWVLILCFRQRWAHYWSVRSCRSGVEIRFRRLDGLFGTALRRHLFRVSRNVSCRHTQWDRARATKNDWKRSDQITD